MKNFDEWNKIKKRISEKTRSVELRVGEIWISNLGVNVGFETDGKNNNFIRPVLVIKTYKNSGAIILPMTSKKKRDVFHYKINGVGFVKLTQIRFLDIKRFNRKIDSISKKEVCKIKNKLFRVI